MAIGKGAKSKDISVGDYKRRRRGLGMFVGVHLDEILRGILSQRSPLNPIVALSASVYFYRNAGIMCSANSSIWCISSSHDIMPWSKNQANHSRLPFLSAL